MIELAQIIKDYDVIGIDFWDALIVTPGIETKDYLEIVKLCCGENGSNYLELRKQSETFVVESTKGLNKKITLQDIYDVMKEKYGGLNSECMKMQQQELRVLKKYCLARMAMAELIRVAKEHNKTVVLFAQSCLSITDLQEILINNGIIGIDKIYEIAYGCKYVEDEIYNQIFWEYGGKKKVLYFGCGKKFNNNELYVTDFVYYDIPKTVDILKRNKYLGQLYNNYVPFSQNNLLIGFSALQMFGNPFEEYDTDSYFDGKYEYLCQFLLAPFFLIYTIWMLKDCSKNKIKTLCYVYRDGYLIEKIHRQLALYLEESLDIKKIYLTRAICNIMNAGQRNGLYNSLANYKMTSTMTVKDFIRYRLGVEKEEEYQEALAVFYENGYRTEDDILTEKDDYFAFAKKLQPFFDSNIGRMQEDVINYCSQVLEKENDENIAVFDVGYRGSACKFIKKYLQLDVIGYHVFEKEENVKTNLNGCVVKSPVKYGLQTERGAVILNVFIEDILNAPEATVTGVSIEDNVISFARSKNYSPSESLRAMQKEILDYTRLYVKLCGKDIWGFSFDIYNYFEFLKRFLVRAPEKDRNIFSKLFFSDSNFMNPAARNLYREWILKACPKNNLRSITMDNMSDSQMQRSKFRVRVYNHLRDNYKELFLLAKKSWYLAAKEKNCITRGKAKFHHSAYSKKILREMNDSVQAIKKGMGYRLKPTVIFCGHIVSFDKGACNFVNHFAESNASFDVVLVSEVPYLNESAVRKKIRKNIDIKIMHKTPMSKGFDVAIDMPLSYEVYRLIKKNKYLEEAVQSMRARFPEMGIYYAEYMAWYLYIYYNTLIDLYCQKESPVCFAVWNEFTTMHHILKNICAKRRVPVLFMEFGVLPGTFSIEQGGQMGESWPAENVKQFLSLKVSEREVEESQKLIEYLKVTGMNRNIQPINGRLEEIKERLVPGRPVIVYFGQNDFESGMYPYTENTKRCHSPFYRTSEEAAICIEKIAIKNNYNYIYKPHPLIYSMYGTKNQFSGKTIIANDVDINLLIDISDVCITILSQAAYIALIRSKPVLMLGYTQLRGKGCAYELNKKSELEIRIKEAVKAGYTFEQAACFNKHVAQLNKYYLYDDLNEKSGCWGRKIPELLMEVGPILKTEKDCGNKETYNMKIAVCAQMPAGKYSGGRSHAWNIAEALSMMGNDVYFLANDEPVFMEAISGQTGRSEVHFIRTNDYKEEEIFYHSLDYVFLCPHRDINDVWYKKIRKLAIAKNAKLILLNYESGNWVNQYLDDQLDMRFWDPWIDACNDGCMVLSSDKESMNYAKQFYNICPEYTKFDYWYPPINSIVADTVKLPVEKEDRIIAFIRLKDRYKGSFDILEMIDESMRGYTFVFIYGGGEIDDAYHLYVSRLNELKEKFGIFYEIHNRLSDYEKFVQISKAKVLLFPSYFEGYGTPPVEALYCQTACIAYDLPVLRESCGNNLIYAEYGNVEDLRAKTKAYMDNYQPGMEYKEKIQAIADFYIAAKKLDRLLRDYINMDWRNPKARIPE